MLNEELILKGQPSNVRDRNGGAILKEEAVVGHVSFNPFIPPFLRRDMNSGFSNVVGKR